MARRDQGSEVGALVGGLIVIVIAIYIIKWLLITAAVLAVPFGIWWLYDFVKRAHPESTQRAQNV